ncbi:MAG TPA: ABC transporter ATP-binding protein [Polyangia bacterium]|nr:ABC transporter ATP-binding protein [Polyangia bacterium]
MSGAGDAGPLLQVRGLTTVIRSGGRELPAVSEVSFTVAAGRTLGLVGESGCGKSLTALSILRLLPEPAARIAGGAIYFDGVDLAAAPEAILRDIRGRSIAMIFQEPSTALNPVLTIADQVGEPLRIHQGLSRKQADARAVALLEKVGIPAAAERARAYPHQLSGGMKQRATIAMALSCAPRLLIADEPTTALDVTVQAQILQLLGRLGRELGMAQLLITHDLGVVAETCDDVAVMYAGRIVEHATASALFAAPRHPYTVGLLRAVPRAESTNPAHAAPGSATRARLLEIAGTVPPLSAPPPGCAFADRCPRADAACRAALPKLAPTADDPAHLVRCIHPHAPGEKVV